MVIRSQWSCSVGRKPVGAHLPTCESIKKQLSGIVERGYRVRGLFRNVLSTPHTEVTISKRRGAPISISGTQVLDWIIPGPASHNLVPTSRGAFRVLCRAIDVV